MKKILIDARMINHSGIGTYLKSNLHYIIPKFQGGITLLGNKEQLETFNRFSNVQIINDSTPIYSIKEQLTFYKYSRKYDLVWVPHYNVPIFSKKFIVTIHDLFHLDNPQWVKGGLKKVYPKVMFNIINKRAKKIFTVSNFSKERYKKMISNERDIIVTYNGIDSDWFNITSNNVPHDKPYLLFIGNVKPHKNIKTLLKAFKLIKTNSELDLVIVGKKEGFITGEENINDYIKDIKENVFFTGYIDENLLKEYVKNASLFVFPSFYEGFGLPPLEAMAAGCPTVVSNAASIPEICGDATLYFDPFDHLDMAKKIELVLKDDTLREKLISKGKKRAQMFNWENSAEQVLAAIEEVLED